MQNVNFKEHEEIRRLSIAAQDGDQSATLEILRRFSPLVYKFVDRYNRIGETQEFVQVGNIGVLKALAKWDRTRVTDISAYVSSYIIDEMLRHCAFASNRLSGIQNRSLISVNTLSKTHDRDTAIEMTAAKMNRSVETIRAQVEKGENGYLLSIDHEDFGELAANIESPIDTIMSKEVYEKAKAAIDAIPDARVREIMTLWFLNEDSDVIMLKDIGNKFGITPERVRQIINKNMPLLRQPFEKKKILAEEAA